MHIPVAWSRLSSLLTLLIISISPAHGGQVVQESQVRDLIVIDHAVADVDTLLTEGQAQTVLRIGPGDDPLAAIDNALREIGSVRSVHVLSHGAAGGLYLGGQWVDQAMLSRRVDLLDSIGASLIDGGELLLYGCEVAATESGRAFVDTLAKLTGASVAASTNMTGGTDLGGDWNLEYSTGEITASVPFDADGLAEYQHLLTHGRGGSITWQTADLDGDGQMNDVVVTVKTAWRASWTPMPLNVPLSISPQPASGAPVRVSHEALFVNGTSGSNADYALVTSVFHIKDLDPNTRYTVWNNTCCRISPSSGLQNNADMVQRIQSEIFIRDGNLAPKIDLPIVFQVPQRKADGSSLDDWIFALNSSDPNADTLRYRLSTDAEMGGGGQVNPPGLSINPNTGVITWIGSGNLTAGHYYNASIVAEDLDEGGNRKSMTQVDLLLELVDAPQTEFAVDGVPETRKVFVPKGETSTIEINGDAINTQSLGDLQGSLTKDAESDIYTFDPGAEGTGLDPGTYPITFEIRDNTESNANNYLIVNYVVPDPRAPWVDHIEGLRRLYTSPDEFLLIGDPDTPAVVTYTENPTLNGGVLKLNVSFVDGEYEVLGLQNSAEIAQHDNEIYHLGNLIGTVHETLNGIGRPLHIDLTTDFATVEAVQALIRHLAYRDTFTLRQPGDRGLSLFLRDQEGRSNSYDFFIEVQPHPDAPEDSGPPVMASNRITVLEGETAALSTSDINFVDPDHGAVTLEVVAIENGHFEYVANPGTPITSFTQYEINLGAVAFAHTGDRQAPSYTLIATSAGGTSEPHTGNVTFFNKNLHSPEISGDPDTLVAPGEAYLFEPVATDEDLDYGDELTFSIANRPSWATFDTTTGTLAGTPSFADLGRFENIVITATDKAAHSASLPAFTIDVRSVTGEGTAEEPFVIAEPTQLPELGLYPESHFVIDGDLDLSEVDWQPIGSGAQPFTGTLIGGGAAPTAIYGLNGHPLFDVVGAGATIGNLRIVDSHAEMPMANGIGLFANILEGTAGDPIHISGVYIDGGSISGSDAIGALAGSAWHAVMTDVVSSADVAGEDSIGGLIGRMYGGAIENASASGNVSGMDQVGGLIGYVLGSVTIEQVYATGHVIGDSDVGGLIGLIEDDTELLDVYATGSVTASGANAGSLIGRMIDTSLERGYGTGAVEAAGGAAGGLIGLATGSTVDNAFWDVDTTGQSASAAGTPLASTDMRKRVDNLAETNYTDWSFEAPSIWRIDAHINGGYPYFDGVALYEVTADIFGNGVVHGLGRFPIGTQAWLTFEAGEHYLLEEGVQGDCGGQIVTDGQYLSGKLYDDCEVLLVFELQGHFVTVSAQPSVGGSVSGSGFYTIDASATVTATAATGYDFHGWLENGVHVSTASEYTFAVTATRNLTADFRLIPLLVTSPDGDDVTGTPQEATRGETRRFTISGSGSPAIDARMTRNGETVTLSGEMLAGMLQHEGEGSFSFLPRHSGRYEFTVIDPDTGLTETLTFVVYPQISFSSAYQVAAQGTEVTVRFVLDDAPVDDQAAVGWQTSHAGLASGLDASGTVSIANEDRAQTLTLTPSASTGAIVLEMIDGSLDGARFGTHRRHTISLHPVMPISADLLIMQDGRPTSFVAAGGADVTVSVADLPTSGSFGFYWLSSDPRLPILTERGQQIEFPAPAQPGVYMLHVRVMDSTDGSRNTTTQRLMRVVSAEDLAMLCPGGDCTDSTGSGIADSANQCSNPSLGGTPNLLQLERATDDAAPQCLMTTPGYALRIGSVSTAAGRLGARIESDDIAALGATTPAVDHGFEHVGTAVDFELFGLDAPGQAAMVVIPLLAPIPQDAVWRKFDPALGWYTFSNEGENAMHSSTLDINGRCPAPSTDSWSEGLEPGHQCVRLTIVDGGPNDIDGEVNGVIRDPGTLAVPGGLTDPVGDNGPGAPPAPQQQTITSGGGGTVGPWMLLLLAGLGIARTLVRRPARLTVLSVLSVLILAIPLVGIASERGGAQPQRWYAGIDLGRASGEIGAGDVEQRLGQLGVSGTATVSGRNRTAQSAFVGYRFGTHFAVEGGHTDLGKVRTQLTLDEPIPLPQGEPALPVSGRGYSASALGLLPIGDRATLSARVGLWHGKARYSTDSAADSHSRRTTRAMYGIGAQWRATDRTQLRIGVDRYRMNRQDVDVTGIGAAFIF